MAPVRRRKKGGFIKNSKRNQIDALNKHRNEHLKVNSVKSPENCNSSNVEVDLTPFDHNYFASDENIIAQQEEVEERVDENDVVQWRSGRRIVELGTLADGLRACQLCSRPLFLHNCVGERKYGLAHILKVRCDNDDCRLVNDIPTGSKHKTADGGVAWDINTKLATGMINVGLGETHINNLLAALNVPQITQTSLRRREREVGMHLSNLAKDSCKKRLAEEVKLSEGNLTVGFDGAWQKRGTGRSYNSLTGHASLFGDKTKKCLNFSVKGKKCRICAFARKKGVSPRKHKCSQNWTGSAKAMEPAMACEMLQEIIDDGEKVQTLVMDNDSTTIARVKATVDNSIVKKSDRNHTIKGITGSLIEMSNTHKLLKNVKVRTHIQRCFSYCVAQNRGNPTKLAENLEKIVPHLYGDHDLCGTWCKSEKTGYKPKQLPYGKPLTDQSLRTALESLFSRCAERAEELADLGSTQNNENFNHMVASKAPKRLFYGGSDSLTSRISATVCQKNEGYGYISEVYKKCAMSPGRYTLKRTKQLATRLSRQNVCQKSRDAKRRRLELKSERSLKDATHSVLEGTTYQSMVALNDNVDIEDISLEFVKEAPQDKNLIFFDLETTDLARTSDIVQIAASTNEEEINIYITPSKPISIGASEATGLTFVGGELKYKGVVVETEMPKSGLRKFVTFIRDHPQSILVGHNIQNFDVPILTYQLAKHGLKEEFSESIIGYMDTLKIAKKTWKKQDVENYKQENLVKKFLMDYEYPAHNALADVKALKKLFEEQMAESVSHKDIFTNSYYSCKASLEPLQTAKALSGNMSRKLVECSLSLAKLKAIHKRDPQNGIRNILSESAVTKCKNVISKITNFLDTCI